MTATVGTITFYQAECQSCGWWGDPVDSEELATEDAANHDATAHDDWSGIE